MPIRRKRVVRRRRPVFRKKRHVPRRMRDTAKKFFKLKRSFPVTGLFVAGLEINDDPSSASDWTNVTGLFQEYRVCALKLKWIPYANAAVVESAAPTAGSIYTPITIVHSVRAGVATPTFAEALAYNGSQTKNCYRPWKYYRKMMKCRPKSDDTAFDALQPGYLSTGTPRETQSLFLVPPSSGTDPGTSGVIIVTYYLSVKARF